MRDAVSSGTPLSVLMPESTKVTPTMPLARRRTSCNKGCRENVTESLRA